VNTGLKGVYYGRQIEIKSITCGSVIPKQERIFPSSNGSSHCFWISKKQKQYGEIKKKFYDFDSESQNQIL